MADVFDEVDEELRRDRAEKLWKKYGAYVMGAAVAIVVAAGAYSFLAPPSPYRASPSR